MIFDRENNVKNIYFLYFDIVILTPVEEEGGEMSSYQSVDSATGTCQVRGAVGQAGAQAARQHTRHVHGQHLQIFLMIHPFYPRQR